MSIYRALARRSEDPVEVEPKKEQIPIVKSGRWAHEGVHMEWDDESGRVKLTLANHGTTSVILTADDAEKVHDAFGRAIEQARARRNG